MQSHREERNCSSRKCFNEVEKGINISVCLVWNTESHTRKKYKELVMCPVRKWLLHKSKIYCPKGIPAFSLLFFLFHLAFLLELHLPARQGVKKLQCTEEYHLTTKNISRLSDGVCALERINWENVSVHRLQNFT